MLEELVVENLVLVRSARLSLHPGLNVLTGETGAGKTILAEAVGLLLGGRADASLVGPAASEAYVEATFSDAELPEELTELAPEGAEGVTVARRVGREGRSRALLYGRSCTRDDLERIGQSLIEMVSQHEARRLVRPAVQLDLLDASGGDDLSSLRTEMGAAWRALVAARRTLAEAEAGAADEQGRLAELQALADAVEEVDPQPGEEDGLARERSRLRHLDILREAAQEAAELLNPDEGPGAVALAGEAAHALARVREHDAALAGPGRRARAHRRGAARGLGGAALLPQRSRRRPGRARPHRGAARAARRAAPALRRRRRGRRPAPARGGGRDGAGRGRARRRAHRARRGRGRRGREDGGAPRRRAPQGSGEGGEAVRARRRGPPRGHGHGRRAARGLGRRGAAGRARARCRRAAPGRQPGPAGGPARERRLGRRALAHRAGRAPRGARRGRDRDARLRRGRRRHRRPHGARPHRQAARARGDGAGALHHAPAADRGGRRPPLPGREDAGRDERGARGRALARRGARGARAHARRRRGGHRRPRARGQPARRRAPRRNPFEGCPRERGYRWRTNAQLPPQRPARRPPARDRGRGHRDGGPRPPLFQTGRYAALGAGGSLSFVVSRQQITQLQVRMPLACQDKRTHAHSGADARLRAPRRARAARTRTPASTCPPTARPTSRSSSTTTAASPRSTSRSSSRAASATSACTPAATRPARPARARSGSTSACGSSSHDRPSRHWPRTSLGAQPSASAITPPTIAAAPAMRCQPPRSASSSVPIAAPIRIETSRAGAT